MNNKIRFYGIQLLIPLFLFAFQNHGIAQCTVLGHAIQISEFGCSNDVGKICLFTVADKLPTNHTWTAKLEYPFGSFIYTDLGDFALVSSNPNGNVVLAGGIMLYSDGVIALCLEGAEQIPGTSYTMSIVNESGDVAFERTFTISTKAIGNANQTILASDVIANGDLLPSTSSSNGQHIRIEGKLIFDIDYNFGWSDNILSEIIMGENATIEVGSDTRLGMDRVLVHGCNDVRWDKILLQSESEMEVCFSTFRDAKKAIVLGEIGDFTSKGSLYENNLIGLESVGTPGNKNDTDIHFYGNAWYPNVFRQGHIGLNLDYTFPQTISGTGLKFENLNQGIHVYHGGLTITSTSFNSTGVSFNNCHTAVKSNHNSLLAIYGAEMYNCSFGFRDVFSQEEIIKRSLIQTTNIPFVKYAAENSHTLISDNHTISSGIDLYGRYILPSRAEVQNNRFDARSLNILLYGYGNGEQKWAVQNNPEIVGFENSGNDKTK